MCATGNDAEVVLAQSHDREVALEATVDAEHGCVDHATDRDVHLSNHRALDRRECALPHDGEDGERCEVDEAGRLAHLKVLGVDDGRPPPCLPLAGTRHDGIAELLDEAGIALIPPRSLPADRLEEDGTE